MVGARMWTADEDVLVERHYPDRVLLKLLPNRTWEAIVHRASRLRVSGRREAPWKPDDYARLDRMAFRMPHKGLAKILGRSTRAVLQKIWLKGLKNEARVVGRSRVRTQLVEDIRRHVQGRGVGLRKTGRLVGAPDVLRLSGERASEITSVELALALGATVWLEWPE